MIYIYYISSWVFTTAWGAVYQIPICRSGISSQPPYSVNETLLWSCVRALRSRSFTATWLRTVRVGVDALLCQRFKQANRLQSSLHLVDLQKNMFRIWLRFLPSFPLLSSFPLFIHFVDHIWRFINSCQVSFSTEHILLQKDLKT